MQEGTPESERHDLQDQEDRALITGLPTGSQGLEPPARDEPSGEVKDPSIEEGEPGAENVGSSVRMETSLLPQRGVYYAVIAGIMAGLLSALLTILILLLNSGTFQAARQQIALDRLTVKTALALAGWEFLTVMLSLVAGFVVGWIVGRIAVRRRLGFLAGVLAGATSSLLTFLVSLLPGYPGNLIGNSAGLSTGSLVISLLLLCLWSMSGGLVSLLGTWVATVRHPHYLRRGE